MEGLIEAGAKLNLKNERGEGVLHYAVHMGRSDLVNLIVAAYPDISIKGSMGKTPYKLALFLNNQGIARHLKKIEELFEWLEETDLAEFKGKFIQHAITKPLLVDMDDSILSQMGIDPIKRKLILKACKRLDTEKIQDSVTEKALTDENVKDMKQNIGVSGEISGECLEYLKKLGTGAAGDVYKGLLKTADPQTGESTTESVAIKVLKELTETKEVDEFKKEYAILSAIEDKNIVKLFGASFKPRLCMVMEYCARGSLYHVLKDESLDLGWARIFGIAKDCACGVRALHNYTPQILHRDIKSLNLLVTQSWAVKVGDFGLSRFNIDKNLETMKQMRGTFAYLCPEVYLGEKFTVKSDIYAVGVILWELAVRCVTRKYQQPYSEFKNIQFDFQIIIQAAKEGKRPTIPETIPKAWTKAIKTCWDADPNVRPDSSGLVKLLRSTEKDYKANKGEWEKACTNVV